MPKPQWLKDHEQKKERVVRDPDKCGQCAYFGAFVRNVKHRGREYVELRECDIHPNCLNTKYSIYCDDFTPVKLV